MNSSNNNKLPKSVNAKNWLKGISMTLGLWAALFWAIRFTSWEVNNIIDNESEISSSIEWWIDNLTEEYQISSTDIIFNNFKETLEKEQELKICFEDIKTWDDKSFSVHAAVWIELWEFVLIIKEIIKQDQVIQDNEFFIMDSDTNWEPNYIKGTNFTQNYIRRI